MNLRQLSVCLLLIAAVTPLRLSLAAVGDTEQQLRQKYGQPTLRLSGDDEDWIRPASHVVVFQCDEYELNCFIVDGISEREHYVFAQPVEQQLDPRVRDILDANMDDGGWKLWPLGRLNYDGCRFTYASKSKATNGEGWSIHAIVFEKNQKCLVLETSKWRSAAQNAVLPK